MSADELHVYFVGNDEPMITGAQEVAYSHGGIVVFEESPGDSLISTLFPWHKIDRVERHTT